MNATQLNLRSTLSNWRKSQNFLPSKLGMVVSPIYITRRKLLDSIKMAAPEITGTVLDFGCGSKPYESIFRNATRYIGLDIKTSGHNHRDSKIDVFYDGNNLPLKDDSFDSVVSLEVLEHVFDINHKISEIKRILKPNGKLLMTTPFAWGEHEQPYDFARYTSFGLRHLLEKEGFEVLAIQKTTSYFLGVSQLLINYLAECGISRHETLNRIKQITLIAPLTLIALALDKVLPKRYDYYSNVVILAKNKKQETL